jgi:hypothetical protein
VLMATKRKMKRYENGGEVGEPVGDSNAGMAEAYNERIAREAEAPVSSASEEAEVMKAAPVRASRPAIVTPAQIKAAGFSNLTDYLNDKQNLTRRGISKERLDVIDRESQGDAMAMRNKPRGNQSAYMGTAGRGGRGGPTAEELETYSSRNKSAVDRIPRDKSTVPAGESASGSDLGRNVKNTMGAMAGTRLPKVIAGVAGETMAGKRAAAAAEKLIADRAARVAARRSAAASKGDRPASMSPFAKGGAVSSASKRADGCALRGKTRA